MAKKAMMAKVVERGLEVHPAEVDNFAFDHIDIKLAEALIHGHNNYKDIAEFVGDLTENAVTHRLLDPVRAAWISRQIEKAIQHRLGLPLAAVYNKVVRTGDSKGMALLLKHFGREAPSKHMHAHVHMDLSNLTDEQLDIQIRKRLEEQKRKGIIYDTGGERTPTADA